MQLTSGSSGSFVLPMLVLVFCSFAPSVFCYRGKKYINAKTEPFNSGQKGLLHHSVPVLFAKKITVLCRNVYWSGYETEREGQKEKQMDKGKQGENKRKLYINTIVWFITRSSYTRNRDKRLFLCINFCMTVSLPS